MMKIIGDPHFGKTFPGLPKQARDFLKQEQKRRFRRALMNPMGDICVCLGDLFDRYSVSNEALMFVYQCYQEATACNPEVEYMVLAGNHDLSKDKSKVSSLDMLRVMTPDIFIDVGGPVMHGDYLLVPYSDEPIDYSKFKDEFKFTAAFTHANTSNYGSLTRGLLDVEALSEITDSVFNGHEHVPSIKNYGNLKVTNVGSIMPFGFGQDPKGEFFVTVRQEDITDVYGYKNKIVKIITKPGEPRIKNLPGSLHTMHKIESEDKLDEEIKLDPNLNVEVLFNTVMEHHKVTLPLRKELWSYYVG